MLVERRNGLRELVVTGPWTTSADDLLTSGQVDRLVLNYALGFQEESLEFLAGLPIQELIVMAPQLQDLEPIHSLGETLQSLTVTVNPRLSVDLNCLPRLRRIGSRWSQVETTIANASTLEYVFARHYTSIDLQPLSHLSRLQDIMLKDRPKLTSLGGLASMASLRRLGIYGAPALADITDLAACAQLEGLTLEACSKLYLLEPISGCHALRTLDLGDCGPIVSLLPLKNLQHLESVDLSGSTNVEDDDLRPLTNLPELRELRMKGRKSYQPSVVDVQTRIETA